MEKTLDKTHILQELKDLLQRPKLTTEDARGLIDGGYRYEPLQHYLNSLLFKVKPETAIHDLFKELTRDVLGLHSFPEVNIEYGFVDVALMQRVGNPVMIEMKSLFKLDAAKSALRADKLIFHSHIEQVKKYLRNNEYVILTNLADMFIFSREALLTDKPFASLAFVDFLEQYTGNLWDDIRRLEDRIPRPELDQAFFEDLVKWYDTLATIDLEPSTRFQREELIVLFLNKMIFIKTLEDYGLIPYKFTTDLYTQVEKRWYVKGYSKVFEYFFDELENWFWDYYDTELFKTKFWDFVNKNPVNVDTFRKRFTRLMGLSQWDRTFGKGLIHYNYRQIDEDIFGKAYETFIAENRKDAGIYYTPRQITQYMAKSLVERTFQPLFEQLGQAITAHKLDDARTLFRRITRLTVIDPCSGSGSFLIKVLRDIYELYKNLKRQTDWIDGVGGNTLFDLPPDVIALREFRKEIGLVEEKGPFEPRKLIARIILRHIHAIDVDERALDTAKTNLWKEAVKLDPDAFNFNDLPGDKNHILPDLEMNFIRGDGLLDLPLDQQLAILQTEFKETIVALHRIRAAYVDNPFEPDVLDDLAELKRPAIARLQQELPDLGRPVFMALEFFHCYFDENGQPLPEAERGFDGVISNPPWEAIKPVKKEFAQIDKFSQDGQEFTANFNAALKSDPDFKKRWEAYNLFYDEYRVFIREQFEHQGSGDLNYYKVFLERDLSLLRKNGVLTILIPSGFQTDRDSHDLRQLIFENHHLRELYSFENRGYKKLDGNGDYVTVKLFPDVDNRFKFSIVIVEQEPSAEGTAYFEGKFYMQDPVEISEKDPISYNVEMVKRFSPENLSIMEFRSEKDYQVCMKIKNDHPLLTDHGYRFRREFHMRDDNNLFQTSFKEGQNLALFEGKMIHQFNPFYDQERYFIDEEAGREPLLRKEIYRIKHLGEEFKNFEETDFIAGKFKLDYEDYRLVYRAIASSTNERTLICSLIPKRVFTGNSVNHVVPYSYSIINSKVVQTILGYGELVCLMTIMNSFPLNYYIRNKVSANLNMFYLYELPVPTPTEAQKAHLVREGFALLARHDADGAFDDLRHELGLAPEPEFDPIERRAALEVYIARELYGLNASDWDHLTSTFVYGSGETRQELDGIIDRSRALFAEAA